MATNYRPRAQTAKIIADDLVAHGPSTTWQIRQRTGLTHMQYWYGLGYLRDVLQRQLGLPVIYSPRRGVYALTTNTADVIEWAFDWRFVSLHTQLSRVEETMAVSELNLGSDPQVKMALAAVTAARTMIAALLP